MAADNKRSTYVAPFEFEIVSCSGKSPNIRFEVAIGLITNKLKQVDFTKGKKRLDCQLKIHKLKF